MRTWRHCMELSDLISTCASSPWTPTVHSLCSLPPKVGAVDKKIPRANVNKTEGANLHLSEQVRGKACHAISCSRGEADLLLAQMEEDVRGRDPDRNPTHVDC